jgi:hypothetical protein
VKDAITADINDLVIEFWRTSSDRADGAPFFVMRRLFEILQECFDNFDVCFDITSGFATVFDSVDKT